MTRQRLDRGKLGENIALEYAQQQGYQIIQRNFRCKSGEIDLIAQDKKVRRGALTFILARGIGRSFVAPDVDPADVRAFLGDMLAQS